MQQISNRFLLLSFIGLSFVFIPLYVLTKSPVFAGDGLQWFVNAIRADPFSVNYGDLGHFIHVPFSHFLAKATGVSLKATFLGLSLLGALFSIWGLGLLAAVLIPSNTKKSSLFWLSAFLFGFSLHTWFFWNGEVYSLATAFLVFSFYFYLTNRILLSALIWALAVLSHAEYCLAFGGFAALIFFENLSFPKKIKKCLGFYLIAAGFTVVLALFFSWWIGKWNSFDDLIAWIKQAYELRQNYVNRGINPIKAVKGLFTAFFVGGHFLGDALQGRGQWQNLWYVLVFFISLLVAFGIVFLAFQSVKEKKIFLFCLSWIFPVQVFFNWRLLPQVEEYHAASVAAYVLLIASGLWTTSKKRQGLVIFIAFVFLFNLFAGVLPIQRFGQKIVDSSKEIQKFLVVDPQKSVFISCHDEFPIKLAGGKILRRDQLKNRSELAQKIKQIKITDPTKHVYVVACNSLPEELSGFILLPTLVKQIPLNYVTQINLFSWKYSDIFELYLK